MAINIQIRIARGTTVPGTDDLVTNGELGFRSGTNELYIRDGLVVRQLTGFSGTGDLFGPASSVDNYIPQWDGTTGKTLKGGVAIGGNNGLVQLTSAGKLPAVDGSLLTNLPIPANAVAGPATNTDGKIPQWDGANSKLLKDGLSVVTTVGSPGTNTNIPTEAAVRTAIGAVSVAKKIVHNWAIDGNLTTGDLAPMIVRAPFTIKNFFLYCASGLSPAATLSFQRKEIGGSYGSIGTQVSITSADSLQTSVINTAVTGTALHLIMPMITNVTGTVTDTTVAIEIEY